MNLSDNFLRLAQWCDSFPEWLPCLNCDKTRMFHIDDACFFASTTFSPADEGTLDLILDELRRRLHAYTEETIRLSSPRSIYPDDVHVLYRYAATRVRCTVQGEE